MAIMLAVNSAADKSSCPFGSLRLLDIISLSQLACVSNDEIWGPKPLARQDKAVRSCLPHPNFGRVFSLFGRVFSLLVLQACECVFHTELSPFSMRRFPDHRSMDGCELQLFSFPERDVVVPTLRDARQRTSEPSLSHCGPGVNFRPTEPLGSSLPHWATVKGVPNYRNAAVRGFMLSVAFSTHAYPNVLCSSGLVSCWRR